MGTKTQKLSNIVDQIVEWQAVKTASFNAVAGEGYFVNTTSGAITVTLTASPKAGDVVQLKDYARTWGTNAVTMASTTFDGVTNTPAFSTNGQTVTLIYMDGTKGWSLINEDTTANIGAQFVTATGGTVTTDGDYKVHSFTGDGCFVVSVAGNPAGSTTVAYLVVAGGGAGSGSAPTSNALGGGGAGGFREGTTAPLVPYTASPLVAATGVTVTATTYPIVVGAGGTGGPKSSPFFGTNGVDSSALGITSAGGGYSGRNCSPRIGNSGGSGGGTAGGGNDSALRAAGNTPPVSPSQGFPGGSSPVGPPDTNGGGGGGATAAGGDFTPSGAGPGGAGATTSISGSSVTYAGGGGGGAGAPIDVAGTGGAGGGATGGTQGNGGTNGTANTGGGAGGMGLQSSAESGSGGSGIVIIRYKFQ